MILVLDFVLVLIDWVLVWHSLQTVQVVVGTVVMMAKVVDKSAI